MKKRLKNLNSLPYPFYQDSMGYYFWDETGTDLSGPYNSIEEAEKDLDSYADFLNGKPTESILKGGDIPTELEK